MSSPHPYPTPHSCSVTAGSLRERRNLKENQLSCSELGGGSQAHRGGLPGGGLPLELLYTASLERRKEQREGHRCFSGVFANSPQPGRRQVVTLVRAP